MTRIIVACAATALALFVAPAAHADPGETCAVWGYTVDGVPEGACAPIECVECLFDRG